MMLLLLLSLPCFAIAILTASTCVVSIVSTIATFWGHNCHVVFLDFLDYGYLGGPRVLEHRPKAVLLNPKPKTLKL